MSAKVIPFDGAKRQQKAPKSKYSKHTLADLARSGLDEADAKLARIEELSEDDTHELTGGTYFATGYVLPYPTRKGKETDHYRIRFHKPQPGKSRRNASGKVKKGRYFQKAGTPPRVFWPSNNDWTQPATIVTLTEGEKKAIKACKDGIPTIGLGGIYMFESKAQGIELPDDLRDWLADEKPEVEIAYDGGWRDKEQVRNAAYRLADRCMAAGAKAVRFVELPDLFKLDDYLVKYGREKYLRLPRTSYDVKAQIAMLRGLEMPRDAKLRAISDVVLADLKARGDLLKAATELVYFDRSERLLYFFTTHKKQEDQDFRAYVNDVYGINGAEFDYLFLHEDIATYTIRRGQRTTLYRFAHYDPKTGTGYISANDSELYRVSLDGEELLPNGTDGILMRPPSQFSPPVVASKAGREAFDTLLDIPNFAEGKTLLPKHARLLYEVFIWALLFPDAVPTRPPVLFHGVKGSHKTSGGRSVVRTLYGPEADVGDIDPKKLDAVDAALVSQHLCVFDNVDGKYPGLENRIALAATGGYITRRTLYTTLGETRLRAQAFIVCTAREPTVFVRDDVNDRMVYLPCERSKTFLPEAELNERIDQNRPNWWRYVLDMMPKLSRQLQRRRKLPDIRFRMADFAGFALRIGPALGWTDKQVIEALTTHEREKNAFSAEYSPMPEAIALLVKHWGNRNLTLSHIRGALLPAGELMSAAMRTWQLEYDDRRGHPFPFRTTQEFGMRLLNEIQMLRSRFAIESRYDSHGKRWLYKLSGPLEKKK